MRFFAFLTVCIAFASISLSSSAEEKRILQQYTLKDGRVLVALRSMKVSADGKTSYTLTLGDGTRTTFDDTQLDKVEEVAIPVVVAAVPNQEVFMSPLNVANPFDNQNAATQVAANAPAADVAGQNPGVVTIPRAASSQPQATSTAESVGPSLGFSQDDSRNIHHHYIHRYGYRDNCLSSRIAAIASMGTNNITGGPIRSAQEYASYVAQMNARGYGYPGAPGLVDGYAPGYRVPNTPGYATQPGSPAGSGFRVDVVNNGQHTTSSTNYALGHNSTYTPTASTYSNRYSPPSNVAASSNTMRYTPAQRTVTSTYSGYSATHPAYSASRATTSYNTTGMAMGSRVGSSCATHASSSSVSSKAGSVGSRGVSFSVSVRGH